MTEKEFNRAFQNVQTGMKRAHREATEFVAVDRVIMLGRYAVGRMKTKNFAIRTANALNKYKPNERGV